jgi:hypothetical protein
MKSVIFLTLASVFARLATATDDFGEFSVPATKIDYDESSLFQFACEGACLTMVSESVDIDKCTEYCLNNPVGASSLLLQWCIMLTVVQNFLQEVQQMYDHCERECILRKHFAPCVMSCVNRQ